MSTFPSFTKLCAPSLGYISWKDDQNKSHYADYCKTNDAWALANGLEFEIFFEGTLQVKRFAKLLKTVVYVCVDEKDDGTPFLQKWKIENIEFPVA